jgi:FtsH-binding integral membrane protein
MRGVLIPNRYFCCAHGLWSLSFECLPRITTFACVVVLACCEKASRVTPTNYVLLFVFTFAESYLVATVASYYDAPSVGLAVGMTAFITIGLSIYAFQVRMLFCT